MNILKTSQPLTNPPRGYQYFCRLRRAADAKHGTELEIGILEKGQCFTHTHMHAVTAILDLIFRYKKLRRTFKYTSPEKLHYKIDIITGGYFLDSLKKSSFELQRPPMMLYFSPQQFLTLGFFFFVFFLQTKDNSYEWIITLFQIYHLRIIIILFHIISVGLKAVGISG